VRPPLRFLGGTHGLVLVGATVAFERGPGAGVREKRPTIVQREPDESDVD
jgi:hypothetical protein